MLVWWVQVVISRPLVVIAMVLLVTLLAAYATISGLGFHTDTADMIDAEAPFKQIYRDYKAPFPVLSDNLTVILEAETPDQAAAAQDRLARALADQQNLFPYIYAPGGGAFFARNGLLYLDREALLDLLDSLAESQPLLQRLRRDMTLRGFLAVLDLAVSSRRAENGDLAELDPLFARMGRTLERRLSGEPAALSWQTIMSGEAPEPGDYRRTLILQPDVSHLNSLIPGQAAVEAVRTTADRLGLTEANGVKVWLTGSLALANDELRTVRAGAETAGWVSFLLVTVILWLGVRSLRLVVAALVTLLAGLLWTAGFAALAIGHLNMISVAFAVLFVGLGIDFSIHMVLRLRELSARKMNGHHALITCVRTTGSALILCAVSTAVGFYAFMPTAFAGVSELGIIAGTGMVIALLLNLTLLPAILSLWHGPRRPAPSSTATRFAADFESMVRRNARLILWTAGVVALAAAASLPGLRFDYNPINLQNAAVDSVKIIKRLMAEGDRTLWSAGIKVTDPDEAAQIAAALEALDEVDLVVSIADFVPPDQDTRHEVIQDIAFLNAPDPFAIAEYPPPDDAETLALVRALAAKLSSDGASGPAADLADALRRLAGAAETDPGKLDQAEQALLGTLPGRLDALDTAMEAEPFAMDDLPATLTRRYVGTEGSLRLEIYPSRDIVSDNRALRQFVSAVRGVDPRVTGHPVIVLEAGRVVMNAFIQALITALLLIALLLLAVTRHPGDTIRILSPLLFTALATAALMSLADMPLTFANIIVLPLLLGIGVDSGVHLIARQRADPEGGLLASSTARAVLVSAFTTMAGFGSLVLSPHTGTAGMGSLLLIGVGLTVLATLILLPAMIYGFRRTEPG